MGKTYLLTGGAGYLGNGIVETLCGKNVDDVTTLKVLDLHFTDEQREEQGKVCRGANIGIEWIEAEITDYNKVLSAVRGSDVVIHTASVIDVHGKLPFRTKWNVNVGGTINLLKACDEANVRYFIYTSSVSILGPNRAGDPLVNGNEESEYVSNATNSYPVTKGEAEKKVLEANGTKTADGNLLMTCSLRPTSIFGDRSPFLKMFIEKIPNKKIHSLCKPTDLGSFVYVGNAAWCHILAAQQIQIKPELIGGNIFFLGDDTPQKSAFRLLLELSEHQGFYIANPEPILPRWSLMFLSATISKISTVLPNAKVKVLQEFPTPFMLQGLCANFTVSHAKFQRHFDYVPLYSWEETRDRTRKYIDQVLDERDEKTD